MEDLPALKLYNTLTREKVDFQPIDPKNVRMYVCGPTVYDFAHIGNARPVIVFDVLYRLLKQLYPGDGTASDGTRVTYARNITDVDDKINARALRDFPDLPLNDAIRAVTEKTETQFLDDAKALGCLEPTHQPRATDNIAQMIEIIEKLIVKGHAYVAAGEVLFDTKSMADYGQLSKRPLDEQQAGARIAVEAHKKNPQDFVLWKLSSDNEPGWESPWGRGRPGWHIECSAMSERYLGQTFDIHGGGLDLIFPHHENEIAQSRCAHGTPVMANVWMHNGFLQVEGRKMSKSEGNFVTIQELLHTDKFGGRPWHGGVLRFAMLLTNYREPIDWTTRMLVQARQDFSLFSEALLDFRNYIERKALEDENPNIQGFVDQYLETNETPIDEDFILALKDDLNTSLAISNLRKLRDQAKRDRKKAEILLNTLQKFGFLRFEQLGLFEEGYLFDPVISLVIAQKQIMFATERFRVAQANNDIQTSENIISEIKDWGVRPVVLKNGLISINSVDAKTTENNIQAKVDQRLELLKAKNFAEADKIRDDLLAKGIQLKDGKDAATGERITTWEVKR